MTRRIRSPIAVAALAALTAACGGGPAQAPARPATPVEQAAPPRPAELTTAEAVLEASLVAQGGRARIGKVQAIRQLGRFEMPQMGMKGAMTALSAPPRDMVLTIELPGLGQIRQGVSGDVAWHVNPVMGARVSTGDERAQLLREATFNADLVWKELYPKAELAGGVDFAGQPAYKVVLTASDGDTQTRYFAKDTLLPLGVQMVVQSPMGKLPAEVEMSDWREVGGIKYAHKIQRKEGPQTIQIVIDTIELDPALDPATFALPPEIVALQQKPAAPAAAPAKPSAPTPAKPATKPKNK
jgi:hypothetical protein